ncbi:hypothetical protein DERF_010829 [Dermatophagoides farinae]|uniref:Uncharacterized protein n=1 Tax=Dermatophagoides farinae TaxID=6954 RepID=A0A922HTT5_DERFA|nr:hypothetical protein DERF_010829 [Dermatophagoides farinae]
MLLDYLHFDYEIYHSENVFVEYNDERNCGLAPRAPITGLLHAIFILGYRMNERTQMNPYEHAK